MRKSPHRRPLPEASLPQPLKHRKPCGFLIDQFPASQETGVWEFLYTRNPWKSRPGDRDSYIRVRLSCIGSTPSEASIRCTCKYKRRESAGDLEFFKISAPTSPSMQGPRVHVDIPRQTPATEVILSSNQARINHESFRNCFTRASGRDGVRPG